MSGTRFLQESSREDESAALRLEALRYEACMAEIKQRLEVLENSQEES